MDDGDKEDEPQTSSLDKLLIFILLGGIALNGIVFCCTKSKHSLPQAQPASFYGQQFLYTNIPISDYVARLKYDASVMSDETNSR